MGELRPTAVAAVWAVLSRPRAVSGRSVVEVCAPVSVQAVSPWRARMRRGVDMVVGGAGKAELWGKS